MILITARATVSDENRAAYLKLCTEVKQGMVILSRTLVFSYPRITAILPFTTTFNLINI